MRRRTLVVSSVMAVVVVSALVSGWQAGWPPALFGSSAPAARAPAGPAHAPAEPGAVQVSPGRVAMLRLANGWVVKIPAGSVARSGTLSGTSIKAPAPAPSGMALAGPVYDLRLAGTSLAGTVRLTVPVPPPAATGVLAGPDTALLVYYDSAAGRWRPVTASYDPATRTLTATSLHLSIWSVLVVDTGEVLAAVRNALAGFLGVAGVAPLSCPGARKLAGLGVTVASADSGDQVKWCAGVSGSGSPVVQVADNRNYAIELDYPATWQMRRLGPADPVFEQILTSLPTLSVRAPAPSMRVITIPPGHTVELRPRPVEVEEATAFVGIQSILINAILYGVDTAELVGGLMAKGLRIAHVNAAEAVAVAFKAKDCLTQVDALSHGLRPASAHDAGELFRSAADLAAGCLDQIWPALLHARGADAAFIASVLLWLPDGVKLILADLDAEIDDAMYPRGYHIMYASLPGHWQRSGTLTDPTAGAVLSMAVSPADGTLATGHYDGSSYLWNMANRQEIATVTRPVANSVFKGDQVLSLAFGPDGKTLAAGLGKGLIALHDVAATRTIATFDDGYGLGGVSSLAFSPDGKTLAAADLGGRGAYLWDVATGRKLALFRTKIGAVTSVAFSPDGKTLATGGDNGTVLWDVATGRKVATFGISGSGPIVSVAFSPDGSMLATGGFKGAVLWDISTERRTATLPNPATAGANDSVAFSPDGAVLATAGVRTRLWDTVTGGKIAILQVTANSVAFSPDGQTLATGTDHNLILWTPAG